ncbi:CDK5 regulatory subunit-associated protein 3-like [Stylophora pistillata]|uniref:CDK5 regulatory subunit-associated protein 3 n=1 Tax=Stylophora pistillata TaxID=50429 RepID=A0A2B4RZY6_STYPI|nr:CDK5 regulatory subunit-associated protein 3-like [Stylophora pistillata]PFX23211.1 CDK5 regulatory subunit-associated protein 3 [Stylophora pistillata]
MQKQGDSTGNAREAELLPIDIYYNKLLDWLLDRRHCDVKWQTSVLEVREKINAAIQDMPPVDEITQLLSGTYINYFHCIRIVELLKISESATKNIFGGYSSKRMKDWQEIVKLYEKSNINLAEAAHLLIRNVNYEIPSLKRQIAKCQQMQRECTRKESEYSSNAALFKEKYQSVCKQMGIKGDDVKTELMSLLNELPELYKGIVSSISNLKNAILYYEAFVNFLVPRYNNEKESTEVTTPLIRYVQQHGNSTVYQWRTGKIPSVIILDKRSETTNKENEESGDIDWGIETVTTTNTGADNIDWGEGGEADAGGIDWGDSGETIDWGEAGQDNQDSAIDWGDDAGTADHELTVDSGGITLEESGQDEEAIRGEDAETLMDTTQTRNLLIDELLELQGFLRQRLIEMKSDSDVLSANQFQSAPQLIQMQSVESVQSMESAVTDVLSTLTSMKMHNLFLLKTSPRYLDRLADSLQQKLKVSEKLATSIKVMADKRQAAIIDQRDLEPKLEIIRTKTKELQGQISQEISKKYKDRPVNIMGEINTI